MTIASAPPASGPLRASEADGLLGDLSAAQRHAVITPSSPLCVLAGAGAGKTRVLTRRIAYQVATERVGADHVLALTFTRRAARELGSRLQVLGLRDHVTAGTFHAVASAQLRRWWSDRGREAPTLLTAASRLVGPLMDGEEALRNLPTSDVLADLSWARARLVGPDRFAEAATAAERRVSAPPDQIAALYSRYESEKRKRGLVDFDDLLALCADAMDDDPRFAAAQHWHWRHVLVDEFQDVNPLQHRLLLTWLRSGADLSVVGDPRQAVYGWNGADPSLLDSLPARWPTTEVVRLDENHRCSPQIVAAGAAVLGDVGIGLRSLSQEGPAATVCCYPSEFDEAAGVASGLRLAHLDGLAWSRMAVLVRTNAQARPLHDALEAAGIPCHVPNQRGLLNHPAAREALDGLRLYPGLPVATAVADLEAAAAEAATRALWRRTISIRQATEPGDPDNWPASDETPVDPTSRPAESRLARAGQRESGQRESGQTGSGQTGSGQTGSGQTGSGQTGSGQTGSGESGAGESGAGEIESADEERARILAILADLARDLRRMDHRATVASFLSWLPSGAGREPAGVGEPDAVTISSFHRSKGLEWSAVWICGLEHGLVPIGPPTDAETEAEERRLLYVAITRAERQLHCSWAARRTFGGRSVRRQPSPWLSAIGDSREPADTSHDVEYWRSVLAEQRQELRGPYSPDGLGTEQAVARRLRTWRDGRARAVGVEPHVLLPDQTVEALVALRPVCAAELIGVAGLGVVSATRLAPALLALVAGVAEDGAG